MLNRCQAIDGSIEWIFLNLNAFDAIIFLEWLRLLHSLSRVAVGLSVGCETWPQIDWHYLFVIDCSKYCMGLPHLQWIVNSHDWWEFPLFFRGHWQSSCTAPSAGNCLLLGLCKGTVKESRSDHGSLGLDMFILASAKLTSPAQGWGLLNRFHPFN